MWWKVLAVVFVGLTGPLGAVWAEDEPSQPYLPKDEVLTTVKKKKKADGKKKKVDGWHPRIALGVSASLASSSNVVGQIDGVSMTAVVNVDGGFDYRRGPHEWRNAFKLSEAFSRTPAIDEFVKSSDVISLDSTYLYHFKAVPWIGPFARVEFATAIFEGRDIRANESTYSIQRLDGSIDTVVDDRLRLSDPFSPLTLGESVGVFAQPVRKDNFQLEVKLGFGARHIFADDALAVDDDGGTDVIEVNELEDVHQGGPAADVELRGKMATGLNYFAGAEVMIPVIRSKDDPEGRDSFELANVLIKAGLSMKLASWASLDYQLRALRQAQIVDKFQVQNNLLLTFTWSLLGGEA